MRLKRRSLLALGCLAGLSSGLLPSTASAQNRSITSSVIAGGGGTSSGGAYAVTGAIAQPEAHAGSSGSPYTISGGFFGQYIALQKLGAPRLLIRRAGANVQLVWPASVPGWILQQNTGRLTERTWVDVTAAPTVAGDEQFHEFPVSGDHAFFRLRLR